MATGVVVAGAALLIGIDLLSSRDDGPEWPPAMTGPLVALVPSDAWLEQADTIVATELGIGEGGNQVQLATDVGRGTVHVMTIVAGDNLDELLDSYGDQAMRREIRGHEGRVVQPDPTANELTFAWEETPGVVVVVFFAVDTNDLLGDAIAFADGLQPLDQDGWDQFLFRDDVGSAAVAQMTE